MSPVHTPAERRKKGIKRGKGGKIEKVKGKAPKKKKK